MERIPVDRTRETIVPREAVLPAMDTSVVAAQQSVISWRAIFAGTFVSILTYLILMSLGLAIGSGSLQDVIHGANASGLGIGAGLWLVLSIVISLFTGAYAAARVSGMITSRIGRTQGIVVTALFFGLLLSQLGSAIATVGKGVGSTIGAVGGAVGDLSQNQDVQDVIDSAIGDLNLRSSPDVVAKGVATRLVRGDQDGAINYLSRQANITPVEARARLDSVQRDVSRIATDAGMTATRVVRAAGWTLFGALLLGMLSGMLGGGMGAAANLRVPLSRSDRSALLNQRAA